MKIIGYIAVFLIALMALTVVSTAGVIAAPKVAAQPVVTTPSIPVKYAPGKTYVFLPWKYNFHATSINYDPNGDHPGMPKHFEYAKGATAYSSILAKTTDEPILFISTAANGVKLKLTNAPTDMTQMCRVTITASYFVSAKDDPSAPSTSRTQATVLLVAGEDGTLLTKRVESGQPNNVEKGFQKFSGTFKLSDVFSGSNLDGIFGAYTWTRTKEPVQAQATATATVYSITISFPQTPG